MGILVNVALVATVGGQPAFESVQWNVYGASNRHSQIVQLKPASYNICVKLRGKSKCKMVDVKEGVGTEKVVLNFKGEW